MRVLMVTHETSRTGAPRIAVLAARSLLAQGHTVQVLARSPGPLLPDFEAVAPTRLEPFRRVRRRLRPVPGLGVLIDTLFATATLLRRRCDLVYVNSTSAAVYLRPARWLRRRTILHVHESGPLAADFLRGARVSPQLTGVTLIACSPSVQADLATLTGRDPDQVPMVPSVPDHAAMARLAQEPPDTAYAADELVVGCCGSAEHRKGVDLWLAAARKVQLSLRDARVRFVWVGEINQTVPAGNGRVRFRGPSPNPYAHMRRFDIATLPSRDDPFPLVVLEAMALGTPVVAFAVGGVAQQVGDAGVLVPPEDVDAFARAVTELLTDADRRQELGAAARSRVDTLYSARAFAEGLAEVVRDVVNRPAGR